MEAGWNFRSLGLEVAPAPAQPRVARRAEPRRNNSLTLVDGTSFVATGLGGDIAPPSAADVGLFSHDTRFVSHWELRVNGHRAVVLSSATEQNLIAQVELTSSSVVMRDTLDLPENTIHIHREQLLAGRFFDRLTFRNFSLQPVALTVEMLYAADFLDIFQVRGMMRQMAGTYFRPQIAAGSIEFSYLGRDELLRQTHIHFAPAPRELQAGQARFELELEPGAQTTLLCVVDMALGPPSEERAGPPPAVNHQVFAASLVRRRSSYQDWERATTTFECSDDLFNRCLLTAMSDFFSLRVPFTDDAVAGGVGQAPDHAGEIVAAGIPWFATIFGRDSLIASYQTLMLHPSLAVETLRFLARHQGRQRDDWRDEEPGKILHEMREGEMTRAGEMPHSPYFGSVDATPLFLIVLDETYNWTGDEDLLEELLPAARRALAWIEESGDLDGDGLVEYRRRSPQGLANQGWKDSWDAYLHRDGRFAPPPIALCEVQGYCYDARYRLSRLLRTVGDAAGADRLRRQATELAHRFERQYWLPGKGWYAAALDAEKNPVGMLTSNIGHLLWSRIIGRERGRQMVHRLMRPDMFSGWGVRTLSAGEPSFNPLSYHRGSIWPHDNSLIAQGFAFYDTKQPLLRLLTGLFQAAGFFRDQRLPELFVGVQRNDFDRPVNYPVSCSPQAWASGAWFLLLTAALGLRPNAGRRELRIVDPVLPEWLSWLRVHHLRVGNSQVSLEFSRRAERTFCNVLDVQGERLAISVDFTPRAGVTV